MKEVDAQVQGQDLAPDDTGRDSSVSTSTVSTGGEYAESKTRNDLLDSVSVERTDCKPSGWELFFLVNSRCSVVVAVLLAGNIAKKLVDGGTEFVSTLGFVVQGLLAYAAGSSVANAWKALFKRLTYRSRAWRNTVVALKSCLFLAPSVATIWLYFDLPSIAQKFYFEPATRSSSIQERMSLLKMGISLNPEDKLAYHELAMEQMSLPDLDAAIGSFKKCIEIDPDFADAEIHLARAYLVKSPPELEKCRDLLSTLLRQREFVKMCDKVQPYTGNEIPGDDVLLVSEFERLCAWRALLDNDDDMALTWIYMAIELDHKSPEAHAIRASALAHSSPFNLQESESEWEEAERCLDGVTSSDRVTSLDPYWVVRIVEARKGRG